MGGGSTAKDHPIEYFSASTLAALINYPLWRASALGQSGFRVVGMSLPSSVPPSLAPYLYAFSPPYKGLSATGKSAFVLFYDMNSCDLYEVLVIRVLNFAFW